VFICILLGLLDPEDEGIMILQHVGNYSSDTRSNPRRLATSTGNSVLKFAMMQFMIFLGMTKSRV
jgi:hypothetical protein